MNILVTGSRGQLGRSFRRLIDCDENAVNESKTRFEYQGNTWIFTSHSDGDDGTPQPSETLDLTSQSGIEDFVLKNNINVIVNCAAYTDVKGAENIKNALDNGDNVDDEVFWLNVEVPRWLANAANRNGAVLIHFSTDYVFNGQTFMPYKEDRIKFPLNYYGKTKADGEDEIINSGCHYIIIRTQWLYSQYGKNFVKGIWKLLDKGKDIYVVDDQIGAPTNAFYLALDVTKLIENNTPEIRSLSQTGIYNYTADGVCSWYDIAKSIKDYRDSTELGLLPNIIPIRSNWGDGVRRPYYSVLNNDKFYDTFKIERGGFTWWRDQLTETLYILSGKN